MDPKRKKLYLILLSATVVLAVGILWYSGMFGSGTPEPSIIVTPGTDRATAAKPAADGSYPPPAVFPNNPQLDTSVLQSSIFQSLKTYSPTKLDKSETGRDDPFKNY